MVVAYQVALVFDLSLVCWYERGGTGDGESVGCVGGGLGVRGVLSSRVSTLSGHLTRATKADLPDSTDSYAHGWHVS